MLFHVVICFLLGASLIEGLSSTSFLFPNHGKWDAEGKIIDGKPASEGEFPYQVNLRSILLSGDELACGGSLISQSWVLTAGHCLIGAKRVTVRLGSVNFSTPLETITTTTFLVHPSYNATNLNHDIGLVNLLRNVTLNDRIKTIALPRIGQMGTTFANYIATATGWGYTTSSGPVSEIMNYANLTIVSNDRCIEDYNTDIVLATTLCTVGTTSSIQNTCSGDSGSALVLEDDNMLIQVGVASFVSTLGCSSARAAGFVRPQYYWNWISPNTGIRIRQ